MLGVATVDEVMMCFKKPFFLILTLKNKKPLGFDEPTGGFVTCYIFICGGAQKTAISKQNHIIRFR